MKNHIQHIIYAILLLISFETYGQQEAMYSQYMFNTMAVNPAYAGSREVFSTTLLARAQWVGIEGAPVSQTLSMDAPFNNKKIGAGIIITNDKIGLTHNIGMQGSYAYRIRFEKGTLSMGLKLGAIQHTANLSQASLGTGDVYGDAVFKNDITVWVPSAGGGIYLNTDKYYVGVSIPTFYSKVLSKDADVKYNMASHVFAMAGYVFNLNDNFKLKPSTLLKFVYGAPMELDINANLWMYDVVGLGMSYRTGDAVVAMFELQVQNNFRVGYSYDYTTSNLSKYNSGSHEIMLRYEFGLGKTKVVTPRYF
jgi:type IX secretion system PorP/SprF family membrane protein